MSERRLVFDTSSPVTALGVWEGDSWRALTILDDADHQQSKKLLGLIQQMMRDQSILPSDIDAIVVGRGPGSYTGIRVGLTIAKTWAFAMMVPLYTFSSKNLMGADQKVDLKLLKENDLRLENNLKEIEPEYEGDHFKK